MKIFERLGFISVLLLGIVLFFLGILVIQYIVNAWWPFDVARLDLVRGSATGSVEAASILAAADMEIILTFLGAVLITVTGLVLPLAYFINKRFSKYLDHRSGKSMAPQFHVTLRQAVWVGLWAAVCLWLQMNRALGIAVALLVATVLILVEVLLQIRTRTAATT
ncbi:MAG: hypothetical protein CSA11_10165 [Chloroflexi bacterium]|nr:MAG: hypothetical protein CSA11_10165 [Chloroflexota bacterium]